MSQNWTSKGLTHPAYPRCSRLWGLLSDTCHHAQRHCLHSLWPEGGQVGRLRPPVITIFICVKVTIPSHGWFMTLYCPHWWMWMLWPPLTLGHFRVWRFLGLWPRQSVIRTSLATCRMDLPAVLRYQTRSPGAFSPNVPHSVRGSELWIRDCQGSCFGAIQTNPPTYI